MSAPKPRPGAWDERCTCCRVKPTGEGFARACPTGRWPQIESTALWGHEWAAVAWMAAAVEVGDDLLGAAE